MIVNVVSVLVAAYVTILTTAEYRSVDDTAADSHIHVAYIGPLVEMDSLVTLTGTEQIACHGVSSNLSKRTRHAERSCTAEVDSTST